MSTITNHSQVQSSGGIEAQTENQSQPSSWSTSFCAACNSIAKPARSLFAEGAAFGLGAMAGVFASFLATNLFAQGAIIVATTVGIASLLKPFLDNVKKISFDDNGNCKGVNHNLLVALLSYSLGVLNQLVVQQAKLSDSVSSKMFEVLPHFMLIPVVIRMLNMLSGTVEYKQGNLKELIQKGLEEIKSLKYWSAPLAAGGLFTIVVMLETALSSSDNELISQLPLLLVGMLELAIKATEILTDKLMDYKNLLPGRSGNLELSTRMQ